LTKANPRETCHVSENRDARKIEGSKNRDSTVNDLYKWYNLQAFILGGGGWGGGRRGERAQVQTFPIGKTGFDFL